MIALHENSGQRQLDFTESGLNMRNSDSLANFILYIIHKAAFESPTDSSFDEK